MINRTMTLDCHVHAWSGASIVNVPTGQPARPVPLPELMNVWKSHGIDGGVLVQPSWLGTDNSELLQSLISYPDSLRGVVVLDPQSTTSEDIASMRRMGVRAIRFNTTSSGPLPDFQHAGWKRLLRQLQDAGFHIEALSPAGAFPAMAEKLGSLGLPLVFDHFAMPEQGTSGVSERVKLLAKLARTTPVSVKLSAAYNTPLVDHVAMTKALADAIGAHNLVLGSNFPFPRHESSRSFAPEWSGVLSIAAKAGLDARLLAANAARLYGF
ncbi:MAG: amidohydrolase family protein [Beijerinckiaceae bacterium]